jgi:hypothetical protein
MYLFYNYLSTRILYCCVCLELSGYSGIGIMKVHIWDFTVTRLILLSWNRYQHTDRLGLVAFDEVSGLDEMCECLLAFSQLPSKASIPDNYLWIIAIPC